MDALDHRSDVRGASVVDAFAAAGVSLPVRGVLHRIACPADFRSAVLGLAARRGCDAAALAGAALLLGAGAVPDPGAGDAVLELGLDTVHDHGAVRRGLATALAAVDGWTLLPAAEASRLEGRLATLEYRNKALASALERVSFQPLEGGLTQVRDAASLFGFVNEWCFDEDRVVRRFRELAPVYHPDTGVVGCRQRMAQLIEARNLLVRHVRTAYRSGAWATRR